MTRFMLVGLMGLGLVAGTAWAQEAPSGQEQGRGRQGMGQRRGGMGDVEQAVTLTAEQKGKVQELQDKVRQEMREQGGQRDQAAFERMREMRQQLREAAEAGDDAKVESLQKEMNETGMMAQRRKMVAGYYDEVEKILTPEQKKQFQVWRKLQESDVPASLLSNPEALKAALKKLELADLQQNKIEAAFTRYEAQTKELKADDEPAKRAATQTLAAEVVDVLKPAQKVRLAEAVAAERPRGPRGQDGPAGGEAR